MEGHEKSYIRPELTFFASLDCGHYTSSPLIQPGSIALSPGLYHVPGPCQKVGIGLGTRQAGRTLTHSCLSGWGCDRKGYENH